MQDITTEQATFAGVLLLANRMQTHFDAQIEELTLKQWLALTIMAHLPQPISSTALVAKALDTSHQNATKLVTALAQKGFIELAPSPADGRAKQASLTPRADDYFTTHSDFGEQTLAHLFADVTPDDLEACLRTLRAMSAAITDEPLTPESTT
ncbi:MarR family winged helix-turn-helix transcriptional regulator [Propioniferax innocua]|uniref:MarR family transcriptional regulator for hemolysin n=1 Tax=Propioniferax innocua TaxID=1753 RepID=A0A542ZRN3_9ACTN|nr:MarR family transcriptional regulator [Propioniferax innocua]TQL62987.1 MarR family transcriptional regulator for hemolysin [Propioniferax innocua]